MNVLYVALGGAIGAAIRYLAGLWIVAHLGASFPWGTFFVNVTGSFLIGIVLVLVEAGTLPAEAQLGLVVGWFLIAWGIFTAYIFIGSLKVNAAVMVVFLLLTATFFILGIRDLAGSDVIGIIGYYLGIATAIAAWYTSAAGAINTNFGRTVLPVGPRR